LLGTVTQGVPAREWREKLNLIAFEHNVTVHVPQALVSVEDAITVTEETPTVGALLDRLAVRYPEIQRALASDDSLFNVAINEEVFLDRNPRPTAQGTAWN